MKKTFINTVLTVLFSLTISLLPTVNMQAQQKDVYEIVDTPPTYVGGESAMYKFLSENIVYPPLAIENNIQGRVMIQFVIDEKGKVTNPVILRGVDPVLDKEALRVIKQMPNWNPGTLKGKAVKVRYTMPVQFKLNNDANVPTLQTQPQTSAPKEAVQDGKQHVPASKGLVGVWRQSGIMSREGKIREVNTQNYKVINPDGTFYTFIVWGTIRPELPTNIGLYGTYTLDSDSTYSEKIILHSMNPKMNGTSSLLRSKLINENTLLIEYKNEVANIWEQEIWRRVQLANTGKSEGKTI